MQPRSRSPARFDFDKLRWLNNHYLKACDDSVLAQKVLPRLAAHGIVPQGAPLPAVCALVKDRAQTVNEIADLATMFYAEPTVSLEVLTEHVKQTVRPALAAFADGCRGIDWTREAISALIKQVVGAHGLKMPQLAIPIRVLVLGRAQTPAIDAVLVLMPREVVVHRVNAALAHTL